MDTIHTVVRTDLMSGTVQPADLVSARFYSGDEMTAVDNGVIAKLGELEEGQREIYKVTAASSSDSLRECVLLAGVEVMYDERKKNLDEFVNEAGDIVRGYALRSRNVFSVTAEGFATDTMPVVGGKVGVGAEGKLDASGTNLGTCIAVEVVGRYTYYAIQVGTVED